MFLLADPHLSITGMVFANCFIVQELTGYLTLGFHPNYSERGLCRVAEALVTIRECIQDLASFYRNLEFTPTKGPISGQYVPERLLERWVFPCRTKFKTNDEAFSSTCEHPLASRTETITLFAAPTKPPEGAEKSVVVKFT